MSYYDPYTGLDRCPPEGTEPTPLPGFPDYAVGASPDDRIYSRVRRGSHGGKLFPWLAKNQGRPYDPEHRIHIRRPSGVNTSLLLADARRMVEEKPLLPPPAPVPQPRVSLGFMADAPLDGPFWILFNPLCDLPPRVRFRTEDEARGVAFKMFERYGERFYVMECKGSVGAEKRVVEEAKWTLVGG